jgi:uncharacterized Zn finger protein
VAQASLWLDGNALAGLLHEVFAADMTRALRRCQSCGTQSALGAHRAYRGAGTVLRCPVCGDVGLRIASLRESHIVRFAGEWTMELPDA